MIRTLAALDAFVGACKQNGCKLVVTNGCFDVLHPGHVKYLRRARNMGQFLLVLLNGDRSVRKLKGPGRPINNEEDRAVVLNELQCVNGIFIFNEKRATKWFQRIKPHLWVKGGDYTPESLDRAEVAAVQTNGGRIQIIPLQGDISTSKILETQKNQLAANTPSWMMPNVPPNKLKGL